MTFRHSVALLMAGFLAWSSLAATPSVLGVVLAAKRVHLNTTAVTVGATVYDGDHFSTEAGGSLRVRSNTAMFELGEESVVSMRNSASGAEGLEVELDKGTLVFSARAASVNVIALKASIRAAADTRTFAQITVTGPRELRIRAQRGALQFSYRGETETMAEGKTYRVILDQPDDSPKDKDKDKDKKPVPPRKWPKAFIIAVIGEGAAAIALGIHESREPESPDRP